MSRDCLKKCAILRKSFVLPAMCHLVNIVRRECVTERETWLSLSVIGSAKESGSRGSLYLLLVVLKRVGVVVLSICYW